MYCNCTVCFYKKFRDFALPRADTIYFSVKLDFVIAIGQVNWWGWTVDYGRSNFDLLLTSIFKRITESRHWFIEHLFFTSWQNLNFSPQDADLAIFKYCDKFSFWCIFILLLKSQQVYLSIHDSIIVILSVIVKPGLSDYCKISPK